MEQSKIPVLTGLLNKIEIWCVTGFGILGVFVLIPVGSRNQISELLWKSVLMNYTCFTLYRISW
jgi:hypothetical protein